MQDEHAYANRRYQSLQRILFDQVVEGCLLGDIPPKNSNL